MGTAVCAFCGELYDDSRPNCPHCGAERDLTYADDSYSPEFDLDLGPGEPAEAPSPRHPPPKPNLRLRLLVVCLLVGLAIALLLASL